MAHLPAGIRSKKVSDIMTPFLGSYPVVG